MHFPGIGRLIGTAIGLALIASQKEGRMVERDVTAYREQLENFMAGVIALPEDCQAYVYAMLNRHGWTLTRAEQQLRDAGLWR